MGNQKTFYENVYANTESYGPIEELKRSVRFRHLSELLEGTHFHRALVVGCGIGDEVHIASSSGIVAFDLSWMAVQRARRSFPRSRFLQASGTELPFLSQTFDLIICSEVIEHIPQPQRMICEFYRVLKEDGTLLLSTPNWISWWGAARAVGQAILRHPITSGGQPFDDWFTSRRLTRLLDDYFEVEARRGSWYFPPTGWGARQLPERFTVPLLRALLPLEHVLGRLVPRFGHLHVWRGKRLTRTSAG